MTAFGTPTGIPVTEGQRLRLDSEYDNSYPHTRVMGIMLIYVARDPTVLDGCAPLPGDLVTVGTDEPGRKGPIVPYQIPLTARDENGNAITIKNPPGRVERKSSGSTLYVGDDFFVTNNAKVTKGSDLTWSFGTQHLHNVTLASGPVGIGSPNLNDDRTFSYEFRKKGTYRFFCALHPVQMHERVVVVAKHAKGK
jgi:plastocyanin